MLPCEVTLDHPCTERGGSRVGKGESDEPNGFGFGSIPDLYVIPEGEETPDCYHCAEHVYETARAQYGEGTLEAQEWAEAALTRLCLNQLEATVGGLLRMTPRSPEAEVAIRGLGIYLAGQTERVGYDELRRRGLPRGSGGIESATN